MLRHFRKLWSATVWSARKAAGLVPEMGDDQIGDRGYRNYVGGKWDAMGQLQFDFLLARGLRPEHVFYDIGCGALRAGRLLIPYLGSGNYCGIDREQRLLDEALAHEVPRDVIEAKAPLLIASADFEFSRFPRAADYCIAQSLFSHLTLEDIATCLQRLDQRVQQPCRFFATFFEHGVSPMPRHRRWLPNPPWSHSNLSFHYTREQLASCAAETAWQFHYVGDWGHPVGQQMALFEKN